MNKRLFAVALVLLLSVSLALPCLCSTYVQGSGTLNDPYKSANAGSSIIPSSSMPLYFVKNSGDNIFGFVSESVVFEAGETYYLYIPHSVSLLYLYTLDAETWTATSQSFTLAEEGDFWDIYSFTPSADRYGARIHSQLPRGSVFYFDTSLHRPMGVGQVTSGFFGSVLGVGSSLISFVMSSWLPLLCVASMLLVTVLGIGKRFIKGV